MKPEAVIFEVSKEKGRLRVGVHAQDDVVCAYEDSAVSMPALEARCREMVETLNGFGRENFGARSALEKIRRAGQMLWDDILGPASKEKLASADADFLILDLDDRLTHIPWELLRIDQRLLCERFCVGRKRIKTSRKTAKSALRHLDGKKPLSMLILADPKGDLNEAGAEGWRLCNMANRSGRVRASLYSRIAPSEIQMKIRDYDMVHFAGHARYDAQNPENNGWELDGVDFTAADVKKMEGGPALPSLVFSNACQSARNESNRGTTMLARETFGLADAFLFAGVRHYLGPFWEIMDRPGGRFAEAFYRRLLSGVSIGESVRSARLETSGRKTDIGWASYILYGDPRTVYVAAAEVRPERSARTPHTERETPHPRSVSASATRTPSVFPVHARVKNAAILLVALACLATAAHFGHRWLQLQNAKLAAELAERKQQRIAKLIEKLHAKTPAPDPESAPSPSKTPAVAILYDPDNKGAAEGREELIASAIQIQVQKACPNVRFVERKRLDIVLDELNLSLTNLASPGEKLRPRLLGARLILFIRSRKPLFEETLHMKLLDAETGETTMLPARKIDSGRVASQNLSAELIEILETRYGVVRRGTTM